MGRTTQSRERCATEIFEGCVFNLSGSSWLTKREFVFNWTNCLFSDDDNDEHGHLFDPVKKSIGFF